jgi:hypothetical protein
MRNQFLLLSLLPILLCGCDTLPTDAHTYVDNPMCLQIKQKLNSGGPNGGAINQTAAYTHVTEADRARLLKEYNYYGCMTHSDGRYDYPTESLQINEKANSLQPHEIPVEEKD